MLTEYDYIVAGGGTAGCVVAGRLAEDLDARILLIEAGDHNEKLESVHMVGDYAKNFFGEQSWNLKTAPMKHANSREVAVHRGRFLGGSSGTNTCFCIRGTKQDYDDWNIPGWSGDEFFAAMRKAENFHSKDWFEPAQGAHGTEGLIHIEPHDIAPISKLMLESLQGNGLPYHSDMFTTGEYSSGCGHALRTHHKGLRSTGADYLTKVNRRENIDMMCNTLVDKVILEKSKDGYGWQAVGVEMVSKGGARLTARARREVIVSGGAYNSPAVLQRSGIGPRDELKRLDIQCRVDSPGVGKNLQDHVIAFVPYEVGKPDLTLDHLAWKDARAASLAQYQKDKTGFLSTMPFGVFAFARLDERLKDSATWQEAVAKAPPGRDPMGLTPAQPSMEMFHTECAPPGMETEGHYIIATVVELFSMRSTGTVSLTSSEPHADPVIDHNFFDDPLDLEVFSEACHFSNENLMKGAGTGPVMKGSWPPEGKHHAFGSREE